MATLQAKSPSFWGSWRARDSPGHECYRVFLWLPLQPAFSIKVLTGVSRISVSRFGNDLRRPFAVRFDRDDDVAAGASLGVTVDGVHGGGGLKVPSRRSSRFAFASFNS